MSIVEALRLAVRGLLAARLRASLTMLGILIGVGAVIVLVAVGNGSAKQVNDRITSLGTNLLTVFGRPPRATGGVAQAFGSGQTLTTNDVTLLNDASANPDVKVAIPNITASVQVVAGNQNASTNLVGTAAAFPDVRDYSVAEGAFLTDDDVTNVGHVAALGATTAASLFPVGDAVGQTIKVNRQQFTVIGVFTAKGASGAANQDDIVVVPWTTAQAYVTGRTSVNQILVQAQSADVMTDAQDEITTTLMSSHHITTARLVDFQIQNQASILDTAASVTSSETLLLGAIAAISLLVGGIGIMNIMLVTVTERTREIGIRKAIGARRSDIVIQFLIEAVVLSGAGGAVGVAGGVGVAALLPRVSSFATVISLPSILLALTVSVAIGLFFGLYPANRAARLSPIQALRYE